MENKHQQILSEMNDILAVLKNQIAALESKISEYQQIIENQLVSEESVEAVDVEEVVEVAVVAQPESDAIEADKPEESVGTPEVIVEILDAEEESQEDQPDMFELEVMDIELDPSDDLPFYDDPVVGDPVVDDESADDASADDADEDNAEDEVDEPAPMAVIDAMTAKQAWRTDIPGTPVKDIRSAISLNDRILFINYLFGEDPLAFQDVLTKLNAMSSFDEAADYIVTSNPDWDFESDTIYRFMMAIRRRLQ